MWNQAMEVGDRLRGVARTDVVHVRHRVLVAVVLNIKDFVLIIGDRGDSDILSDFEFSMIC